MVPQPATVSTSTLGDLNDGARLMRPGHIGPNDAPTPLRRLKPFLNRPSSIQDRR